MQIQVAHVCVVICAHTHTHNICSQQLSPVGLLTLHSRGGFDLFLGEKKILLLFIFILIMIKKVPAYHF